MFVCVSVCVCVCVCVMTASTPAATPVQKAAAESPWNLHPDFLLLFPLLSLRPQ